MALSTLHLVLLGGLGGEKHARWPRRRVVLPRWLTQLLRPARNGGYDLTQRSLVFPTRLCAILRPITLNQLLFVSPVKPSIFNSVQPSDDDCCSRVTCSLFSLRQTKKCMSHLHQLFSENAYKLLLVTSYQSSSYHFSSAACHLFVVVTSPK